MNYANADARRITIGAFQYRRPQWHGGTNAPKNWSGPQTGNIYFCERNGKRGCVAAVNVNDSSEIPKLAEPWFLQFNAHIEFRIAMTPEDLGKAGLEALGKKWG